MNFNAISLTKYIQDQQEELDKQEQQERIQTLMNRIKSYFSYVIVSSFRDIIHVQYMGPSFENGQDRSLSQIREAMGRGKQINRNSAVSIDSKSLQILHQFGPKAITFGCWESAIAPKVIFHELLKYQRLEDSQVIKILHMPVGLQLQVCWYNDMWLISSRSCCFINNLTMGSSTTVWDSFCEQLSKYDIDASNMHKDRLYTFLLSDVRFNKTIKINDIYLMSVFDRVKKSAVSDDLIKESHIPRLTSKRITIQQAFSKSQLISIIKKNYNIVNAQQQMYSILILSPDNTYYEIETQTADLLHTSENVIADQSVKHDEENKQES